MKYIFKTFISVVAILLISHVALSWVNFDFLKNDLVKYTEKEYGIHVETNNHLRFQLLPSPRIIAGEFSVYYENNKVVSSDTVTFFYNFIDLFTFKFESPDAISLFNVRADYDALQILFKDSVTSGVSKAIPNISMIDAEIFLGKSAIAFQNISLSKDVSNSYISDTSASYSIAADYKFGNNMYTLNLNLKNVAASGFIPDCTFKLRGYGIDISINGAADNLFSSLIFKGDITANIKDRMQLLSEPKEQAESKSQTPAEAKIAGVVEVKNSMMKFDDITVVVNNTNNVRGSVVVDFSEEPLEVVLDLKLGLLDLNSILKTNDAAKMYSLNDLTTLITSFLEINLDMDLLKKITIFSNFEAEKIKIYSGEISKFVFSADMVNKEIYINSLTFNTPGKGEFGLYGATSSNIIREKFIGNMFISIQSFKEFTDWMRINTSDIDVAKMNKVLIQSDVSVIQHRIKLTDVKAIFGDLFLLGCTSIMKDGSGKLNIASSLRINAIDFDNFGVEKVFDDIFMILYNADNDKTGNQYFDSMHDHNWLRYFGLNLNSEFFIDKSKFKGMDFRDLTLSFDISPGFLSINNVMAETDLAKLDGKFVFSLPAFRPHVDLNIISEHLDTQFFYNMLPDTLKRSKDSNINTMSLYNFDGMAHIHVDQLTHDNNSVKDLDLQAILDGGALTIKSLNGKIFDGELSLVGNITWMEHVPQYVLGFALNNIDPSHLMQKVAGIDRLSGYMSLSGSISSAGQDFDTLQRKLQGNIILAGKNLTWKGFGMDDIIKISDLNTTLDDQMQRLGYYTQYGSTFFSNLSGKVDIADGLATFDNIELANNRLKGVFVARYDIANRLLNSVAKFSFIPINESTTIVIQVNSKGQLPTPDVAFDTQKLEIFLKNKALRRAASSKRTDNSYQNSLRNIGLQ